MPRGPEANREIRDERRLQILRAAARVFAKDGFAAAQMDDVAREAGVSKGLIYHYFESKPALFTAIVTLVVGAVLRLHEEAAAMPGRAAERLQWLLERELWGARDDGHMFSVILRAVESVAAPQEARDKVAELTAASGAVMRGLLAAGQAEGDVIEGDPGALAAVLGACVSGNALAATTPALRDAAVDVGTLMRLVLQRR
jgi:AcrR family transcriptional regulator